MNVLPQKVGRSVSILVLYLGYVESIREILHWVILL